MTLYKRLGLDGEFFVSPLFSFGGTEITLDKVIVFSVIILAAALFSRLLQRAIGKAFQMRGILDKGALGGVTRLLHYLVLALAFGVATEVIGINLGALFAAGAIFAIGLGFAMQNIVQNFVSGVILLAERTIKPGDILQVDGRFVKVRHMGIRSTIARTLDEEEIIVPNSTIVQGTVTNYTLQDSLFRLRATVGVIYGSDMMLVRRTLEEAARKLPWRLEDKDPVVFMTDFADSAVMWEVSVWIDDPWGMRRARSDLNEAVWWALKEKGLVIAFPQLDVHLDPDVLRALAGKGARS